MTTKLKATRKKYTDPKPSIEMSSKQNKSFFANLLRFVYDGRAVTFQITNGTQTTFVTGTISRCTSGRPTIYFSWPENFGTSPQVSSPVTITTIGNPRFV